MEQQFDSTDPVQVENLRVQVEDRLFKLAREIAACGLVPTITLNPLTSGMGQYEIEVDVRYGRAFYSDPKFYDFIAARTKVTKAMETAQSKEQSTPS